MYQVIARKYRPAQFSELISQEHVRTTLQNAIQQGRIAHGYILSGQRGTGKTTVARIIARCLNCVAGPTSSPCGECASCREIAAGSSMDVIEIDAASNRGINEMRELRENVRFRPARDRYKVFIIDESHQITSEAFNALLKTLEEPPEWVVFILCTTESHKIPVTIASRCQQFSFRSVDFEELIALLKRICAEEGVDASDEALSLIARAGEGSVRDSLSALDQAIACCGNTLAADEIRRLLGMFSLESLHQVGEALEVGNSHKMFEIVRELETNGRSLHHFCRELARYFRNLLVSRIAAGETRLIAASTAEQEKLLAVAVKWSEEDLTRYLHITLELYKELQASLQPRLHLELGLLRLIHAGRMRPIEELLNGPGSQTKPIPASARAPEPPPPPRPVRTGPSPFERNIAARQTEPISLPPAAEQPPAQAPESNGSTDMRGRMIETLQQMDRPFVVDNLELCSVTETPQEVVISAPKQALMALQFSESDLNEAVQRALGRPVRVKVVEGAGDATPRAAAGAPKRSANEEELMNRALSDPAVQSFQQKFPGAEVRQVRNLKD